MTYGWAILVVMIVGIVMWQLGIFSMGTTTVTSSGFSKIKPQLAGTKLTSVGDFEGIFTNGAGSSVTLVSVLVNNTMHGAPAGLTNATTPTVSAGDNFVVIADGVPFRTGVSVNPGDVYTLDVVLTYDITIGGITTRHSDRGTIRGPYE